PVPGKPSYSFYLSVRQSWRLFCVEDIPKSSSHQFLELLRRWILHEHHVGRNLFGVLDRRINSRSHDELTILGDLLLSFRRAGKVDVEFGRIGAARLGAKAQVIGIC